MIHKTVRQLIPFFAVVCLLAAVCLPLFSVEKTIELGGKNGWEQLSVMDGVTTGSGRFGYEAVMLSTNSRKVTEYTDLLLPFDLEPVSDKAGNYTVVSSNLSLVPGGNRGSGAALSRGESGGLVLSGSAQSIFGSGNWTGSFTIEFWLCPLIVENGETVLTWRSSRNTGGYSAYQLLSASFANSRLEWTLTDLFDGAAASSNGIVLKGDRAVIPGRWAHHTLTYSEESGLLEYRVDGLLEDYRYVTSENGEGGTVYPLVLGAPADIEIAPAFTGKIDDFRILRHGLDVQPEEICTASPSGSHYDRYVQDGGRFESQPIPVGSGSVLSSVSAEITEPSQTAVQLYVRAGDNYFTWTAAEPAWIPVTAGESVSGVSGAYFQIAADLYPDGAGNETPSVTAVTLTYRENPPPLPPFAVFAAAGNGYVDLSWSRSVDETGGYYVYYGERPGEYLGRIAAEGPSPVFAGLRNSIRITGLQNGKIYYFALAAERDGKTGALSKEVYARPMKK
ncbi:Fibronectin type III domain protein [Treponema brennaborense DSM 12168]|uniref:Fibronectin type III domain protein n=1 Tax=Treponema brennaborense (strain DSM 12168 / CIP 105900 / DD5/3) TaxID=906968 RepID=F4LJD5_TREBD|nr:Fibronectin type III domain protein [Treponema brennaborense DSM 12168]